MKLTTAATTFSKLSNASDLGHRAHTLRSRAKRTDSTLRTWSTLQVVQGNEAGGGRVKVLHQPGSRELGRVPGWSSTARADMPSC